MDHDEKRALIECYRKAYNTFDIDGLLAVVHPDIQFENITGGEVNASTSGKDELCQLAEQSKGLFKSRKQTMTRFEANDDQAFIEVEFEGTLAKNLPNGMKKGETLKLTGRSEFGFQDGKIRKITDTS